MQCYGRTDTGEFLGDLVLYRGLEVCDQRLPGWSELAARCGLDAATVPRKSQAAYGQVVVELLRQARQLDGGQAAIQRLASIGDTRLNDGTACANIARAGRWQAMAFIGAETDGQAEVSCVEADGVVLCTGNRWAGLNDFGVLCRGQGLEPGPETVLIIDLDKTALGARGRNDKVIDRARMLAARDTVGAVLGDGFEPERYEAAYRQLNQPEFHAFTADNQDYLAYACLIVSSGWMDLESLVSRVREGSLVRFEDLVALVEQETDRLPQELRGAHAEVTDGVRRGDPTPFKSFRRREYLTTAALLGSVEDDASVERMLADEIVLTQEVRQLALDWQAQGALVLGLSDKPDEASVPTAEQAAAGHRPIHRLSTHAVGADDSKPGQS